MPSYTFTSTATAFALRGAKIVFVDIRKDTMNIDEKLIEAAVTERTRAIVPVHYAGVPCEMDEINRIAKKHGLLVIEDAAQAVLSTYRGKQAGTLGDIGCFSFHETKNFTCGEGGAIILNRAGFIEEAEIIWEKGTNRNKFFRGEVDKYTWVGLGSSYLMSELNAAYLWAQLEMADSITSDRMRSWNYYFNSLKPLSEKGLIELPQIPKECTHNGHMFYLKTKDLKERTALIAYLKDRGIMAIFHYIPLHSSPAGLKFGIFSGTDNFTTKESERLLRLPMYFGLSGDDAAYISGAVRDFYKA
jgi:dTDP-4-amino-4,6-dideoxygalactose transaminase